MRTAWHSSEFWIAAKRPRPLAEQSSPEYIGWMSRFASPRTAIMLVFSTFGALVGVWAGSIPQVTLQAGVSVYQLGLALASSTLAAVLAMSLGGVIGKRLSSRAVLLALLPLAMLLTTAMMSSTTPALFFALIVLQAATMGVIDIFMNAEASAIEHDMKKPVFTAFHGAASLLMAVFAIISSLVSASVGPFAASLAAAPLALAAWISVWRLVPARSLTLARSGSTRGLWLQPPLILMGLAVGLTIGAEGAAVFWSAKLIQEQSPSLAGIFGLGTAFFGLCAASLRFMGDRLRAQFGEINLLLVSFATGAIGYSILGLAPPLEVSVLAFAAIGFGLAVACPCLMLLAARQQPANRAAGMAVISLVAGLPRVLAPWVFGWIAASSSMSTAFGAAAFIPLAGIAIVLWLRSVGIRESAPA